MIDLTDARILITGGAGFIGSHLTNKLLACGCQVTVLDDFSTGKEYNIAPFANNPAFRLIKGDIRDLDCCRKAACQMDYILHEAARGSVPRSIKDPATTFDVNATGFSNIITAAQEAGVKKFIYASSSSVYGDNASVKKQEDHLGNLLSPYAVSKRCNELVAMNFSRVYGLKTIGLRYFNVFGPGQQPDGPYAAVIPKFTAALLNGVSPTIYGNGENSRDFTYVDNVVSANILALTNTDPQADNQIYNVGCGNSTSLNELFDILKQILQKHIPETGKVSAEYAPPRKGDILSSLADIGKISKSLGYRADTGIMAGLEKYCLSLLKK